MIRLECQALISDEVFLEGSLASDVRGLWRRLARTDEVREVSRKLASDPLLIQELCEFVQQLLDQPHGKEHRHPHDIAICAALVLLEQSPLGCVRGLFARLRKIKLPSLVWVRRMAEYCEQRFVPWQHAEWGATVAEAFEGRVTSNADSDTTSVPNGLRPVTCASSAA